jgi:hypothetical protein
MKLRFSVLALLAAATCLLCGGCSGSGRPATAPVRGQVTFRGKPVAGATLTFLCDGAPRPAVGTTDAAGTYQLTTFEPNDGAVVGVHVVTVKKYATVSDEGFPEIDPSMGPAAMAKALEKAEQQTLAVHRKARRAPAELPVKYGHRTTSDLRKEVVEGENIINIELSN